jgi:RNA polymerase sigma-70 factor, ECF subfamily
MEAPPVDQVFVVQPAETIEGVMGGPPEAPTANAVVPRVPAPGEFRALFELYFRYVWHTLARLGVPARDLEDVTHDVFLEIHRHLSDFDPTRSLRPWIFAFAFRVGSHYRRRARHRYETLGDAEAFDGAPSALERVLTSETLEVAHAALGAIEVERRAVLLLHDVDGCSMPEVAEALGVPLNTAYSRLRLARKEFRERVARLRLRRGDP